MAEQAGLNLTWSKVSEDTFSRDAAHLNNITFLNILILILKDAGILISSILYDQMLLSSIS